MFRQVSCLGFLRGLNFFIPFFSNLRNDWVTFWVVKVLQHFATIFYDMVRTLDCVIRLVYFVWIVSLYNSFSSFSLYSVIYIIYTFLLSPLFLRILYYKAIAFMFWKERSFFLIFLFLLSILKFLMNFCLFLFLCCFFQLASK